MGAPNETLEGVLQASSLPTLKVLDIMAGKVIPSKVEGIALLHSTAPILHSFRGYSGHLPTASPELVQRGSLMLISIR